MGFKMERGTGGRGLLGEKNRGEQRERGIKGKVNRGRND
jgi:hypothetical protein